MRKTLKYSFLKRLLYISIVSVISSQLCFSQATSEHNVSGREKISLNFDWKFALGHASDVSKDFYFGTNHFSYLAKTGYGDGAASEKFDDRAWRNVHIPHDWCVTLPFDARSSNSHGSKAIGKYFPENNIGWYRKYFSIPLSDTSKRIRLEFEGVYRNSKVFVNGFYVGTEESGYSGFEYDITEYLNFGGENTIAVRVDATEEEGWFYEGAGIYRNVWLIKTNKIHVARYGTFVSTELEHNNANVTVRTKIQNENNQKVLCSVEQIIFNAKGEAVAKIKQNDFYIPAGEEKMTYQQLTISEAKLWTLKYPYLYKVQTNILQNGKIVDTYTTDFGVRTLRFSNTEGFFLNGGSVKIKGVCVHQDHAGVGVAIPYDLQKWRIQQLQAIGVNAIRTSHNPPSPELLQICDELGMLVMDELRLMGINKYHKKHIEELMLRDRNHPSVFIWSLGNEEWQIEGVEKGAKIIENMQNFAHRLDSTRDVTVAISGGWDTGIGMKVQVMGYNYLSHGDVDKHHELFPWQASIGTEESNTVRTRGVYTTNDDKQWLAPKNLYDGGMEGGWKYYYARPYLSGLFYWTGFDYRGEPTPYGWPAVVSQFGILDLCGFPKDNASYLKAWWPESKEPVLQIEHNWAASNGDSLDLVIYSNCKLVELTLNGTSLGKKEMPFNGHITWPVVYQEGELEAKAFGFDGFADTTTLMLVSRLKTPSAPQAITMVAQKDTLQANGTDVSIITVSVTDANNTIVANANNNIQFEISGPGKLIGVGNGNPSSHEDEQFLDKIEVNTIQISKELVVANLTKRPETAAGFDYSKWNNAYSSEREEWTEYKDTLLVMRGTFELENVSEEQLITLFAKSILENQSIYVNGVLIRANIPCDDSNQSFVLDHKILKNGTNEYCVVGQRLRRINPWNMPNRDPGRIQIITPSQNPNRNLFNGYAQILVQSTAKQGVITVKAISEGLESKELIITTK